MDKYIPKPIDTSEIEIEKSLVDLQEQLSKNIHEVWSKGRIDDGWLYGSKRDDSNKEHPCLVNYDELSEIEKNYDRNRDIETLKFILKSGNTITPPNLIVLPESEQLIVNQQLNSISNSKLLLPDLISLWREHNLTIWKSEPNIYFQLGLCFLKTGEPLLAYDVFSEGLDCFPEPTILTESDKKLFINICQQQALALAETGAVQEAAELLCAVLDYAGVIDGETFGLLGRTYKEMALSDSISQKAKEKYLEQAYYYYFTAFSTALENNDDDDAYYNGINAATVALFKGDAELSNKLASQVVKRCKKVIEECQGNDKEVMYWADATVGEG